MKILKTTLRVFTNYSHHNFWKTATSLKICRKTNYYISSLPLHKQKTPIPRNWYSLSSINGQYNFTSKISNISKKSTCFNSSWISYGLKCLSTTSLISADAPVLQDKVENCDKDKLVVKQQEQVKFFTPESIVTELDKYIIGQNEAKRSLAIALRDRWRRQQVQDIQLRKEITPNNILLIGPSGCGKTELAKRLATIADAPFIKVVATRYTEVGFVGDDTQSMLQDLADQAYADEQRKQRQNVSEEAIEKAHQNLTTVIKNMEGFENWEEKSILQHLQAKKLDDLIVELDASLLKRDDSSNNPLPEVINSIGGAFGRNIMPRLGMTISTIPSGDISAMMQDFFDGGKKSKKPIKKKIKVKDAMPLLEEHFAAELVNDEDIIEAAKSATEQNGIIFIDEFDKLVDPKEGNEFRSKRRGVQKELLTLMEGTTVVTRLGRLSSDHILFIASGAFTSSKPADIMPELQGRLPIRCELSSLTAADFVRILKETHYNPLVQQAALMKTEGVDLKFTDAAVEEISRIAHRLNSMTANVGARRLKTVISKILEEVKFNAHNLSGTDIEVSADMVSQKLSLLQQQADLSKYII